VSRQGGKWTTEDAWENDELFYRLSNSVIVGNALFGLSPQNRGQFFFVDAATGKTLSVGEPRIADNAAIATAGNLLFILKTSGELVVADGSNTSALTPIRTYKVAEPPTWGAPSISGNRIFVKDQISVRKRPLSRRRRPTITRRSGAAWRSSMRCTARSNRARRKAENGPGVIP
jgi:hypothetical protein